MLAPPRPGAWRTVDRLTRQFFGGTTGTPVRPAVMPMDAYRAGDDYVVQFDLPGVAPDSIDLDVEHNVLTVKAERKADFGDKVDVQVAERPRGVFSRQLFLGETLDTYNIKADYDAGVLTVHIPVTEKAKPRKIEISGGDDRKAIDA